MTLHKFHFNFYDKNESEFRLRQEIARKKLKKIVKSISFKTRLKSDTCFLCSNIFSTPICLPFELGACHGSFMIPTGSTVGLKSILVDEGPAMTLWAVQ